MTTQEFQPHTILVTGGAGFIGSNFVHHVLSEEPDLRVVNLDLLTYAGSLENLEGLPDPSRHTFIEGDISDAELVAEILRKHEVDAIVHFAAESHVDRSIDGPAAFVQTNVVGTFTLLDAARLYWLEEKKFGAEQCRFHHVSTDEVYGSLESKDPAFSETTPYAPNSPYSAAKAGSDHLARAYFHTFGLPVVTTNCSNNYGPRQHVEKFIPTIIRSCYMGETIPVYGDGSNVRDWLYVADHCVAVRLVLGRGRLGETYNIGGECERANIDIAKTVCEVMDDVRPEGAPHDRSIQFVEDRPGHDWRYAIDISKIQSELGWNPAETFESGIRKTVECYLQSESWRARAGDGTYAGTRLGLGSAEEGRS